MENLLEYETRESLINMFFVTSLNARLRGLVGSDIARIVQEPKGFLINDISRKTDIECLEGKNFVGYEEVTIGFSFEFSRQECEFMKLINIRDKILTEASKAIESNPPSYLTTEICVFHDDTVSRGHKLGFYGWTAGYFERTA